MIAVKKPLFPFRSLIPSIFYLKMLFFSKKNVYLVFCRQRNFPFFFGVKQIIDSLSFLFLFTHIGLNFNLKKGLNNRSNHENLDLPHLKKWTHEIKKYVFRKNSYFSSTPYKCSDGVNLHNSKHQDWSLIFRCSCVIIKTTFLVGNILTFLQEI